MENIRPCLPEIGIKKVSLIKIDTKGAEYEMLKAMDPEMRQSVGWIIGELHGIRDFEITAYPSPFFNIQVKKSLKKRRFILNARNRRISPSIRK
jgi:hypothetical protein